MSTLEEMKEDIIFYAFRYALGRKSYAVAEVVTYLLEVWDELTTDTQEMVIKEIKECPDLGMDMDKNLWNIILEKESK
jgi:hypothetical protein